MRIVFLVTIFWKYAISCQHYQDPKCVDLKPIEGRHFLNQWIVEIDGDEDVAKKVAEETGFVFKESIEGYTNHYFFTHSEVPRRHRWKHEDSLKILRSHVHIKTVDQQYVWRPTIRQLSDYKEFIGYEKAREIVISNFDPEERNKFYENLKNTRNYPSYEEEVRSPLDRFKNFLTKFVKKKDPVPKLPPLKEILDIEALYEMKKRMKARVEAEAAEAKANAEAQKSMVGLNE